MKKSEFIKKALSHDLNSLFVNKEQVARAIELFEDIGMLPPGYSPDNDDDFIVDLDMLDNMYIWENEDG